jgi:hypothetical protein
MRGIQTDGKSIPERGGRAWSVCTLRALGSLVFFPVGRMLSGGVHSPHPVAECMPCTQDERDVSSGLVYRYMSSYS